MAIRIPKRGRDVPNRFFPLPKGTIRLTHEERGTFKQRIQLSYFKEPQEYPNSHSLISSGLQMLTAQDPGFLEDAKIGGSEPFYCSQYEKINVISTHLAPYGYSLPMGFIDLSMGEYSTPWINSECFTKWIDFDVPLLVKRVIRFNIPQNIEFVDTEKQSAVGDSVYVCVVVNYFFVIPIHSYVITYEEDPLLKIPFISEIPLAKNTLDTLGTLGPLKTLKRQKSVRPGSVNIPKIPLGNLFDLNSNLLNYKGKKITPHPESPHFYAKKSPSNLGDLGDFGDSEYETFINLSRKDIEKINKGVNLSPRLMA